ncbi:MULTISPECIES: hypothetical protein [unclassified Pedobacter]|uniref:hypothetical protein n=1 Tax=unclassified Pedobacter TaxID=2628915 RepID=UPI001DC1E18D|nr:MULTISPECIES: hypothetical protein [unclassified Pedobacter]CAH0195868.1 hypothetical protein SRABI36_01870 [Pedobacter sp. Bi36]CAH0251539.1 hypothetical protein SRABI126_02965 [Pedobacter sp. Bi126]
MAKTKWIIEPSKLIIYPKRNLRIVGLIFFVLIAAIIFFLSRSEKDYSTGLTLGYYGVLLLIPLLLIFIAETKVIFDGNSRVLYKKIGFLPTGSIPFDDIASVQAYEIMGSGYNYRLFKKSNRHGKGIIVSSGYSKATNPNLIQFQQEVLPKIDELVFANAPVIPKQTIYDFQFFKEEGGVYLLHDNKIGSLIIGLILIGVTVSILLNPDFLTNEGSFQKILLTYFPAIIGLALLFAATSNIRFDKSQRKIIRSTFAGRVLKEYPFDDLIRFQIIRKTTNLIYSGTEVRAEILLPAKNKTTTLILKSFIGTKKIERFLDEANTILGRI